MNEQVHTNEQSDLHKLKDEIIQKISELTDEQVEFVLRRMICLLQKKR